MSHESIHIGLIGLGGMGSEHLAKIQTNSRFIVSGLCSIDNQAGRRRMQEGFPDGQHPLATDDYHEVLADRRIEAVLISTPEMTHAEISIAALRAGKHVLCEKAMAPTLPECDQIIEAVRETEKKSDWSRVPLCGILQVVSQVNSRWGNWKPTHALVPRVRGVRQPVPRMASVPGKQWRTPGDKKLSPL